MRRLLVGAVLSTCVAIWPLDEWKALTLEREAGLQALEEHRLNASGANIPTRSASARGESWALFRGGNGSVFFRHCRKAGGTSMRRALQDAIVRVKAATGRASLMPMTHVEWGAFPAYCLTSAPRTFFATVLREPLSRAHSDYLYSGRPAILKARRGAAGRANETAAELEWLSEPSVGPVFSRDKYARNLYVRAFSGRCAPGPPLARPRPARPPRKYATEEALYEKFWTGNACVWRGSAWGGGCKLTNAVGPDDLRVAARVLDDFNVVLALEWLRHPPYLRYLSARLGVKFDFPLRNKGKAKKAQADLRLAMPPPVVAVLRTLDALDIKLHADFFAQEHKRVAAWLADQNDPQAHVDWAFRPPGR